jgi:hypothetical protein
MEFDASDASTSQTHQHSEAIGEQFYVTTNSAIRFGPNSEQYKQLVADEDAFSRLLADLAACCAAEKWRRSRRRDRLPSWIPPSPIVMLTTAKENSSSR